MMKIKKIELFSNVMIVEKLLIQRSQNDFVNIDIVYKFVNVNYIC